MTPPSFRAVRFGEGYDVNEVDDFVDRVERALGSGDRSLTPQQVLQQRFTPTRFGEGYAMDDVDAYLDEAVLRLRDAPEARNGGQAEPVQDASPADRGNVLHSAEKRPGLFKRLFGAGR